MYEGSRTGLLRRNLDQVIRTAETRVVLKTLKTLDYGIRDPEDYFQPIIECCSLQSSTHAP